AVVASCWRDRVRRRHQFRFRPLPCGPRRAPRSRAGSSLRMIPPKTLIRRCLLFLFVCTIPLAAESRIECGSLTRKLMHRAVRYCALLPPSYDTDQQKKFPVLYFLHGLGDNEQSLVNMGAWNVIEELREQKKIGKFVIVTPEADRSFYVNSYDGHTP